MAGIGFKLHTMLREHRGSLRARDYAYFAVAGPWIIAVGAVALIHFGATRIGAIGGAERQLVIVTAAYGFIISQIAAGSWQLLASRCLADILVQNKTGCVIPTFFGLSRLVFGFSVAAAALFFAVSPLPLAFKLTAAALFPTTGLIWLAILFLTTAQSGKAIFRPFLLGGIVSVVCVYALLLRPFPFAEYGRATNLLIGLAAGLAVTMSMLAAALLRLFPFRGKATEPRFLHYVNQYPSLLWIGVFYNLGVWADEVMIWFGRGGFTLEETFRYNPLYDQAAFLSYLSIIPSVALFVMSVETPFYDKCRQFYSAVESGTLDRIELAKNRLIGTLRRKMLRLVLVQGSFTLLAVAFSDAALGLLHQPSPVSRMFKLCALGAMMNSLTLMCILIMLRVDDRKGAFVASALFFALHSGITAGLLPLGSGYYGFGNFVASAAALTWSGYRLLAYLRRIEVHALCSRQSNV